MNRFLKTLPVSDQKRYELETFDDIILLSDSDPLTKAHINALIDVIFQTDSFRNFARQQIEQSNLSFQNIRDFFNLFDDFFKKKIYDEEVKDKALLSALIFEFEQYKIYRMRLETEISRYFVSSKKNKNSVFWPDPTGNHPADLEGANLAIDNIGIINKETPIGSAGSCFADEIAYYLQKNEYNYIVTEVLNKNQKYPNSCAAWGVLFNTPSFMQIAERAFGVTDFPPLIDKMGEKENTYFHDPYRENVFASDPSYIHFMRQEHISAARQVFEQCEVFIITLGLNECFQNIHDGSVVSRNPKNSSSFTLLNHKILTVEENVQCLQRFLDIIRTHNPNFKLIVTVSPVPFMATGRADEMHVVTANTHSKSVLRVAAEEFSNRNENVWYFPAYEVVTVATRDPWEPDLRHVKRSTVARVMRTFERMFVKGVDPRLEDEIDRIVD